MIPLLLDARRMVRANISLDAGLIEVIDAAAKARPYPVDLSCFRRTGPDRGVRACAPGASVMAPLKGVG